MVIENQKLPGKEYIIKGRNLLGSILGNRNVLYVSRSVDYMGVWIYQSSSNCTLKICAFH